jgi:hypothetical protein
MLVGNLALTPNEETAIVEFMKTLSDGYLPEATAIDPVILLIGILTLVLALVIAFMAVRKYRKKQSNTSSQKQ